MIACIQTHTIDEALTWNDCLLTEEVRTVANQTAVVGHFTLGIRRAGTIIQVTETAFVHITASVASTSET